jgi:hypothetical protein
MVAGNHPTGSYQPPSIWSQECDLDEETIQQGCDRNPVAGDREPAGGSMAGAVTTGKYSIAVTEKQEETLAVGPNKPPRLSPKEEGMTAHKNYGWKPPTAAQREARRVFKETGAKVAMSEYEGIQAAFLANRERLKSERLAREAEAAARKHKNLITARSPNVHGGLRHR